MWIRIGGIVTAVAIVLSATAASAFANTWAGTDPPSNFTMPYIPQTCWSAPTGDPTGPACLDFSVSVLDQARASLGQPAYVLPADFDSLSPEQQLFILTNEDRQLYGLSPVPGMTDSLSQAANTGVQTDSDPWPADGAWMAYTSNWAGGFENAVLAYEGWMYDDGPASGNQDCTSADSSGCWGHRPDILWGFESDGGPVAMGAAAGTDPSGMTSYAMLLVQGDVSYEPNYSYTWAQALADGAGGTAGTDGSSTGSTTGSGSGTTDSGTGTSGSGSGTTGTGTSGSGSGTTSSGTGTAGSGSTGSGTSASGSGTSASGSGATSSDPGPGTRAPAQLRTGTSGSGSSGSAAGSAGTGSGSSSGPGTGSSGSPSPSHSSGHTGPPEAHGARVSINLERVRVHGHRISLHLAVPGGLTVTCSLRRWKGQRWQTERLKRCTARTVFRHVATGRYRLRISSDAGIVVRHLAVR